MHADTTTRLALPDLAATHAFGARLAGLLRPGDAILLHGRLGAGKSELARAMIRAAAGDPALDVPSPSYTLVQTYDTPRGVLHHFDLWRLEGPGDLMELGWTDAQDGIVIVEWADRLAALTPDGALTVTLDAGAGDERSATLTGWSERLS